MATLVAAQDDAERGGWLSIVSRLSLLPFGSSVMDISGPEGDLDISLEGEVNGRSLWRAGREFKQNLLQEVHRVLEEGGNFAKRGRRQLVLGARWPISRFVEAQTRVPCDLSIGNTIGVFKSQLLGAALGVDPRLRSLAMVVKSWARFNGVNDPANGTFNSYCLTLLVVTFAQARRPPLLPPFRKLFRGLEVVLAESGPALQDGWLLGTVQGFRKMVVAWGRRRDRPCNKESLLELFLGFLRAFCWLVEESKWQASGGGWGLPQWRMSASPWEGGFKELSWEPWVADSHHLFVQDPFERHDNCARTLKTMEWYRVVQLLHNTNTSVCHWMGLPASKMEASWDRFMDSLFGQGLSPQLQVQPPPLSPSLCMQHQILEDQPQVLPMSQQPLPNAFQQPCSQIPLNACHQEEQQYYTGPPAHQMPEAFTWQLPNVTMIGTMQCIPVAWAPTGYLPSRSILDEQMNRCFNAAVEAAVNRLKQMAQEDNDGLDAVAKPVQVHQSGDSEPHEDVVGLTKVVQINPTVDGKSAEAVTASQGKDQNGVVVDGKSGTSGTGSEEGCAGLGEECSPHSPLLPPVCAQPLPE
ncbi:unnamed protein product [Ostreobium quekettii]|uniref:Poly(A) RNA polymerase mitochondrial-like central palm domain-containing protein n=1 Tax=Ostreobium quekettii TaxID=121088 RepID=A0A8S1INC9_9CHLO|nr:unnamed protein product [Ostreobium quekettii]